MANSKFQTPKFKINISHIAKLANLPLTAEEKLLYKEQLSTILDYVKQIESVDTKNVKPTFNVSPSKNITRNDDVNKSITQDEVLRNSSNKKDGFIVTRGVFESE